MIFRTIAGAAIAALAIMVWGFVFWAMLLPPGSVLKPLPGDSAVVRALAGELPQSGSYYFPMPPQGDSPAQGPDVMESYRRRHLQGPIGLLHYSREGGEPFYPGTYLLGFVHYFVSALLAGLMLRFALPAVETYMARVTFVFGLGLFATVAMRLGDPIWWKLPWAFHLATAGYHLVAWTIAGVVLAALIKPTGGYRHMTDPSKPLWKRALEVN